jgi:3-phenylpropionate/trans-cinnamate dioxygenase ferredoxin reductase subunit
MPLPTFIIAGAGLAGAKAAETLRAEGFDGRLVLIGSEPERPYERPPLSKGYLRGEVERPAVYVHDEGFYADHDIELRTSTSVMGLDPAAREVALADGQRLRFDRLLLALGSEPRRLSVPGASLDGVFYLRDLADAEALRPRLRAGARMVVVGGGWIGAEVAASARQAGVDVTIVHRRSLPLEGVLGAEVAQVFAEVHREHGVRLIANAALERLEGVGSGQRVVLADGRSLKCDLAVVGIGAAPRTELAAAAGLAVGDGVLVDERLETTAAGIFAAGDLANAWHPFYDRRVRVEHWANALNQGPVAARNMLGQAVAYERLPYFYSDQYELGMEYTGLAAHADRVVLRGEPGGRELLAFWMRERRVVAGMSLNVWTVTEPIQALIRSRAPVDARRLADPAVPLEDLAGAVAAGSREGRLR